MPIEPAKPVGAQGPADASVNAIILPTLTPAGDAPAASALRKVTEKDRDSGLYDKARIVDSMLVDASQDLGLFLDLGTHSDEPPPSLRDIDLLEIAKKTKGWVISPRIEKDGKEYVVRIVAIAPKSRVLIVRVERVPSENLAVKTVVMLRDLVQSAAGEHNASGPETATPLERPDPTTPARSPGRAVLSVGIAAFGGFSGLALQKAGRSDDPRLLYPLLALGTGIGLGAATIISDEWEVGYGDAWYLTAGAWWPTTTALLLSSGYNVQPTGDRYAFALLSGLGGTGLATIALSRGHMSEGGGALVHSGGAIGAFLGGATQMLIEGSSKITPYKGLGFGAGAGVLTAGILATQVNASSSRVLLVDVGAGLGALGGAALASPLLFDHPSKGQQRAWALSGLGGALVGAGIALRVTSAASTSAPKEPPKPGPVAFSPSLPAPGVIATSSAATSAFSMVKGSTSTPSAAPVLGMQWTGVW